MKSMLVDLIRKWGVGVCLILWCALAYGIMCLPIVVVLLVAAYFPSPVALSIAKFLLYAYTIVGAPLAAYQFGRAFGLRYDQIPLPKERNKL